MATFPIADNETRNDYVATASQTTFPYTFWIRDEDHLDVYVNSVLQVLTTDYTVSAVQSVSGANIVFNSGLTVDDEVAIVYNPDFERATGFSTGGSFTADAVNLEFTYLLSLLQNLKTREARAVRLPDSSSSTSTLTFPDPTTSASKFLAFDATGELTAVVGSADGVTVSTYGATLIDDADAATARATLGLGALAIEDSINTITNLNTTSIDAEGSGGGNLRTSGNTNCLTWGSGGSANLTAGGNLSMNTSNKIVNCADPTSAQDVATKAYVDAIPSVTLARYAYETTDGGATPTYSSGAWRTVQFNTETSDADGLGTLSSNQVTLGAGTYRVTGAIMVVGTGAINYNLRMYDTTNTAQLGSISLLGRNGGSGTTTGGTAVLDDVFTLAGTATIEMQVYSSSNIASYANGAGTTKTASQLLIQKVA